MTAADLNLILLALNDREGVLSSDWEAASRSNSLALAESICAELCEVRTLANKIANQLIVAKRLAA